MNDAERLEAFWKKESEKYAARTLPHDHPYRFEYAKFLLQLNPKKILEVGCSACQNLLAIYALDPHVGLYGCDVAPIAPLNIAQDVIIDVREASVYSLPYPDNFADVVFTLGLLTHIPPGGVKQAASELVRASSKYIVVREDAEILGDGSYQGEPNAVFIHDYQALFSKCKMTYSDVSTHLGYVKRFTGVFKK